MHGETVYSNHTLEVQLSIHPADKRAGTTSHYQYFQSCQSSFYNKRSEPPKGPRQSLFEGLNRLLRNRSRAKVSIEDH